MSDALRFDVTAADRASQVFGKVADAVEDVGDEIDKLDRKRANPQIDVETKRAEQRISKFATNLRKKVAAAVKNLPELEIDADSSDAEREIAQVRKDLQTLSDVEIETDVDAARAEAKLRELTARITRLNSESVDIKVKADTLAAVKALSSIKLDAVPLDVDTRPATRQIGAFAADARRRIDSALSSLPELEITADSSDADREIADIRNELAALSDQTIGVDIDARDADEQLRRLKSRLDDLSGSTADIRVKTDADAAKRALDEVDRKVDRLDGRTAHITVDYDRSLLDSVRHITRLGAAMRAIAIPSAILVGTPALISFGGAAASAASSMMLLPAAGSAAGLAVGTVVAAFQNFGAAMSDDPEKAAAALNQLTPSARGAAKEVYKLGQEFSKLQKPIQEFFFADLAPRISTLGGKYMPMLATATQRVASQFSSAADEVLQFANHEHTVNAFRQQFASLGTVVGNLTPAILPLVSVLTDVGTVGGKVLADITGGTEDAANGFADMVSRARESGQMEAAIRGGLNELKRFGQLAGNVGGILGAMYQAGKTSGNDFLGTLVNITGRMRDFLSSAQGQAAMVAIFTGINQAVTALLPGLEAVGQALGDIVTNKATSGALTSIASAFSDLLVAAAPTVAAISRVVSVGIQPLAAALSFLAPVIGPVIGGLISLKMATSALNFLTAATGLKTLGSAVVSSAGQMGLLTAGARTAGTATAAAGAGAAAAGAGMRSAGTAAAAAGAGAAAAGAGMRNAGTAATAAGAGAAGAAGGMTRAAGAISRVQSVAGSVGRALPVVGLGFIALDTAVRASTVSLNDAVTVMNEGGSAANAMREKVAAQTSQVGNGLVPVIDEAAASFDNWVKTNIFGMATTDSLNASLEAQARAMHETVGATNLSRSSFDQITGSMDRSKQASQQFKDSVTLIGPAMAGMKNGVAPTKEMDEALKGVAGAARDSAQAAGESAAKLGGVDAGAKAAADSMQGSREAFISMATSAGMGAEEAGKLADKLDLIPKTAETNFKTNAATTALEVQQVADKLKDVPVGKSVTVNAMTDGAKAALTGLGVTVNTLPDGRVEVTANTAQAQANMTAFINGTRDQQAEVTIDGQTAPADASLQRVLQLVAAGRERISIDGNDQPARGVLSHLLGMVQGTNAQITINGNKVPAEQVVNALLSAIDSKSPTVDINGNKIPFDQVMASLSATTGTAIVKDIHGNAVPLLNTHGTAVGAITAPATKPINGDPSGGLSADSLLSGAVQTPATKPVGANTAAGVGAVAGLQGQAEAGATKPVGANTSAGTGAVAGLQGQAEAGATKPVGANTAAGSGAVAGLQGEAEAGATKPVDADTGGARGVVNSFVGWVNTLRAVVNIVANKIGFSMGGIANADGNIVGMADGGHSRPTQYAGHRTRQMHGAAHKVPPNTWRVVGDRKTGAEAYIPITKSVRSQALLSETARRMGYDLVKAGVTEATMSAMPQVSVHVNRPAPILDVGPRVTAAPTGGSPDRARVQAMVDQFGAALRNTVTTARAGQPVDLRPLLTEVATLRGALLESVRGEVNIQNQFAVAEMGQTAGEVARVQRTLSHLGLFS